MNAQHSSSALVPLSGCTVRDDVANLPTRNSFYDGFKLGEMDIELSVARTSILLPQLAGDTSICTIHSIYFPLSSKGSQDRTLRGARKRQKTAEPSGR